MATPVLITRIDPDMRFEAYLEDDNRMTIRYRSMGEDVKGGFSFQHTAKDEYSDPTSSSKWTCKKYSSDQIMKFDALPKIIFSFDERVVKQAISIKYEHQHYKSEYYVLVVKI